MTLSPSQQIALNFFEAVEFLKKEKVIPGIIYLVEKHHWPKTRIYGLQKSLEVGIENSDYKTFPIEPVYDLARNYSISLDFLFFKVGPIKKRLKFA